MSNSKVFTIGLNKSASTSLHVLYKQLGLSSFHHKSWRSGNPAILKRYHCFSDGEPKSLERLDRMFPGSRYILNVRALKTWTLSRLAHIERMSKEKRRYSMGSAWECSEKAVRGWIKHRNKYHLSVLRFFADRPKDLLIVNFVRNENAPNEVCRFLGFEGLAAPPEKPWKNANPKSKANPEHLIMLMNSAKKLGIQDFELDYDLLCPSLVSAGQLHFSPDTQFMA
ncbi:MAG: hypothetical protein AAFX65_13405 [Cyanobacteria bacterium J06638_7]